MSTASKRTIQAIEQVVKNLPIGINLALLQIMWAMVNGSFLKSRGSIHGALAESGFSDEEIRRSSSSLRSNSWSMYELTEKWRRLVLAEEKWKRRNYEGYQPVAVDITTFWRPHLQGWGGQFFHRIANRLMKGVGVGVICEVGEVEGQRIPLLKRLIRVNQKTDGEAELKAKILRQVGNYLDEEDVFVHDAGVKLKEVQEAGIGKYVIRLAINCTGKRNYLPPQKERGRPSEYGESVRPVARTYAENKIPATDPDVKKHFSFGKHQIQAYGWHELVRSDQKVSDTNPFFTIWVFYHPLYKKPWVMATNLPAQAETIFHLYLDRWPVEQPPLVAKQMIGLHRQFVFNPLACCRLPELALLAGNMLTYLAAVLPATPTGFWDRHPKKHLDGFDALWQRRIFPNITHLTSEFEKSTPLLPTYQRGFLPIGG
jgi:hypothetical protein